MGSMLYRRVEENLRVAMRCYARVSVIGETREYPGVTVTSSGLNCAVFNSAMLTLPVADSEFQRTLLQAKVHFEERRLGWTFWLCEDLLASGLQRRVRETLRNANMCVIAEPPGMYAARLQPPIRTAKLEIRPVNDATTREEFAHLSSTIFTLPYQTARMIYTPAALWTPPMRGWIGYFQNRPASIATVVIGGGVAGVYSVGTVPDLQGRGFAETVVRHALAETRKNAGVEESVLQSTRQGLKLYLSMGYRVVTNFAVYLRESRGADR
jgi:ribosomal protein S18 acetylase RimI-like enzyme